MKEPHLLRAANNPRRLLANISHLLSVESVSALEKDLADNVLGLYELGRLHYRFARRLSAGSWRQAVSRLYYAAYNVVRSVRLCVDGHYSQDTKDHQRFDALPDDFPSKQKYAKELPLLRDDRNLCDYDHTVVVDELVQTPQEWAEVVRDLLDDATSYLKGRGVAV